MIELGHKTEPKKFLDGFSEETKPLTHSVPSFEVPPSVETIFHFVNTIFKVEKVFSVSLIRQLTLFSSMQNLELCAICI
jgi:hypothetical protein